jgi:hypothetical protein
MPYPLERVRGVSALRTRVLLPPASAAVLPRRIPDWRGMSDSEPGPFSLLLPQVVTPRPKREGVARPLRIADIRTQVAAYFAHGSYAWLYECRVRQPENLAAPNQFTLVNWTTASLLVRDVLDWDETEWLAADASPLLAALPPDADLFRHWPAIEAPVLELLDLLITRQGLSSHHATALLYQKRPALVPVLDSVSRRMLPLPRGKATARQVFRAAFNQFLHIGRMAENQEPLDRLTFWLAQRPSLTQFLAFSRVRLLNIVATMALQEAYEPPSLRQRRRRRRAAAARQRGEMGALEGPGEEGEEDRPDAEPSGEPGEA